MPSQTKNIPHGSQMARNILTELMHRKRIHERGISDKYDKWTKAEEETLAFIHERDVDRLRKAKRVAGMPDYTTIKIPYTYAVLMAAHTYFTSVFMSRNPVFQYSGRHGEPSMSVMAVEALQDYQTLAGKMLPPLYSWLYDAGKYGLGVLGVYWDERFDYVTQILEEETLDLFGQPSGVMEKIQVTDRRRTYAGNKIYNIQPWDFIWDTRLPVMRFQEGEFCGVRRTLSWNDVMRRKAAGYYMDSIKEIKGKTHSFEGGTVGSGELLRPSSTDPSTWLEDGSELRGMHPSEVNCLEMVVELIPKEWGLGGSEHPEKWVFTCTTDWSVLMGAQPHGSYHCQFPFQILTMEAEAYGIVPRGMPETLEPIQQTIDWLVNSHFYNVRAALNNKFIVDPSRVVMKDLLDPNPGGVIRMKPEAFGTDARLAMHQFQVTDVTQNHLRDLQMMYGMGERTMGVNDQIMGMLNTGGGRKTATEVRTSTSFGVNRLKTTAEFFSAVGFAPLSLMMLQNSQQYYDEEQKFKIVGDLIATAGQNFMMVNPENIQGAYDFVPVDGSLPIDRFAQANLWKELMLQMRQVPEVYLQYDVTRIFEWVAQLAGLKNVSQFKIEAALPPELLLQAKLGNLVPLQGGKKQPGQNGAPGSPGPSMPKAPPQVGGTGSLM